MSDYNLYGKTALVTGGSRGIGRAVCLALAQVGVNIAVNYQSNQSAAENTQREVAALGVQSGIFQADVAEPDAVTAMVADIEAKLAPVDLLVTSAGIAHVGTHHELDFGTWQRIMKTNVDGTFLPVMAVKDGMLARGYGRMVCIASIAGLAARAMLLPYSTSKAAVIGFARSLAPALAPTVRVNCVAPGLIDSDMTRTMDADLKARMNKEAFLQRIGQPEEIADTVRFLLSDQASFITGQTVVADGGRVTLP